jgi:hypothetical protein
MQALSGNNPELQERVNSTRNGKYPSKCKTSNFFTVTDGAG